MSLNNRPNTEPPLMTKIIPNTSIFKVSINPPKIKVGRCDGYKVEGNMDKYQRKIKLTF